MKAAWTVGDIQVTHAELARLIEQTYQYIYSVEDMRIQRRIHKVEDLFESNPLLFDSETVSAQLSRLKKLKQDADLLKSHLQVYNEKMEEQKRCREFTQFIIEKHNIDTSKPVEVTNGEKHVMTCNEDYNAYLTYTENRFFEREKASTRGFKEANELIKNII